MTTDANITLRDRHLRLWGLPIAVIAWTLLQMPLLYPDRWDLFLKNSISIVIFTAILWEIIRRIILHQRQKFPGIANTRQRIIMITTWILVVNLPLQAAQLWINDHLQIVLQPTFNLHTWTTNVLFSFLFIMTIAPIYEAIYFFGEYKKNLIYAEQLKKKQIEQQLNALKTRVNPHFLFNSLTTLSALIGEDKIKAERFVDELSKVYRYLLRSARSLTMTIKEEIEFVKSYVFLLENRLEPNAFNILIETQSNLFYEKTIPTLTFQNVIDYLVRTQNLPLSIDVEISESQIKFHSHHSPKTLVFNTPQNDWRQLEMQGAIIETQNNKLEISIPILSVT